MIISTHSTISAVISWHTATKPTSMSPMYFLKSGPTFLSIFRTLHIPMLLWTHKFYGTSITLVHLCLHIQVVFNDFFVTSPCSKFPSPKIFICTGSLESFPYIPLLMPKLTSTNTLLLFFLDYYTKILTIILTKTQFLLFFYPKVTTDSKGLLYCVHVSQTRHEQELQQRK